MKGMIMNATIITVDDKGRWRSKRDTSTDLFHDEEAADHSPRLSMVVGCRKASYHQARKRREFLT